MVSPVMAPLAAAIARFIGPESCASIWLGSAGIVTPQSPMHRTIWGLDPFQLYTRFWAAHGVQVVRQGEPSQIVKHAELFLLTDPPLAGPLQACRP